MLKTAWFPKIIFLFFLIVTSLAASAQTSDVDMADLMRENGKIYVVISVLSVILAGFIINLILVDRRLKKLEKQSGK